MTSADQINLAHASAFRLGPVAVEPALRQISGVSSETLEPRVMQVLVVLAMANGAIVARDDLVRQCWEGRIVGDDAINRVIARLRKLTKDHGKGALQIETINKVGYRLIGAVALMPSAPPKPLDVEGVQPAGKVEVSRVAEPSVPSAAKTRPIFTPSICVLPFVNMSGEADQEYFSDGVSEDIITDLAKIPGLFVIARNTAFTFKGKSVEHTYIAERLGVSHLLSGSVRKSGARLRISAQLIDGATGGHVWAERYDRDLTDIFALQDNVTEAIVEALKLKLLPQEMKAAQRRGTDNAVAYDLYLMARQHRAIGPLYEQSDEEAIVRLTCQAVAIDPAYARAWAMMAGAQTTLRFRFGQSEIDCWASLEKAFALDPNLSEAFAVKANLLRQEGRTAEALVSVKQAIELDPDSWDANFIAAYLYFGLKRFSDAIYYFERATALLETDVVSAGLLITCNKGLGDREGSLRAARMTIDRAEIVLSQDRGAGLALGWGAIALAVLGEAVSARDWIRRALLIDPDNLLMRYNLACALSAYLVDKEAALDLLGPYFARVTVLDDVPHPKIDPDLDSIRDDPRFIKMLTSAEARLSELSEGRSPPCSPDG